jgi:hypothetical protein
MFHHRTCLRHSLLTLTASTLGCLLVMAPPMQLSSAANQQRPGYKEAKELKKCGVALVMPGYLPEGFKLSSFKQDPCPGRMSGYEAIFKGPNRCEFTIRGSNGGWGAPGPIRQWKFRSPLLGPVTLEEWDGSMGNQGGGANYLNAAVLPSDGDPVLSAYPKAGYVFNFSCYGKLFSPESAKRIIMGVKNNG